VGPGAPGPCPAPPNGALLTGNRALVLTTSLVACAGAPVEPLETAATAECSAPSASSTLTTWCTSCHSALAADRHGAPEGVDFDTLDGARLWSDRIRARALDAEDMPYGGGIPAAERARLDAWLSCGLPGDDPVWPAVAGADHPDSASDRDAAVLDDDGDLVLVVSWGGVEREALRFRTLDGQGFWVEEVYLDEDGAPSWSRAWDPPILIWDDRDSWTESVTATRDDAGVVTTTEETWTVQKGQADVVDARLRDQDAVQLVLSASSGDAYTWLLSTMTSFAERTRVTSTEEDVSLGLTMPGFSTLEGFPLEVGPGWAERGYTRAVGTE
jgi:hypothetical protein